MSIIIIIKAIILMAAMTKNILTQVKTTFLGLGAILQLSKTSGLYHSDDNHSSVMMKWVLMMMMITSHREKLVISCSLTEKPFLTSIYKVE